MKTTEEIYKEWVAENPIDYINTKFEATAVAFAQYYAKIKGVEKATAAIKEIRKREENCESSADFCRAHNFPLECGKFDFGVKELRNASRIIELAFNTGYVGA